MGKEKGNRATASSIMTGVPPYQRRGLVPLFGHLEEGSFIAFKHHSVSFFSYVPPKEENDSSKDALLLLGACSHHCLQPSF
jgi:hypothetical protein